MLDPQVVTLGLLDSSHVSVAQWELICREAMKRTTKTGSETLEVRKVLGLHFL